MIKYVHFKICKQGRESVFGPSIYIHLPKPFSGMDPAMLSSQAKLLHFAACSPPLIAAVDRPETKVQALENGPRK